MSNTHSNKVTLAVLNGHSQFPRILSCALTTAVWLVFMHSPGLGFAADGSILWGSSGIKLAEEVSPHSVWNAGAVSDASGGAVAVWTQCLDSNPDTWSAMLVAQRLDASGTKLWAGGGSGPYVSTKATCHEPALAADGAGGVIVAWWVGQFLSGGEVYAQRLDANGTKQWGANDVQVGSNIGNAGGPRVVPDDVGGAFVGWAHRLTHVQPNGSLDAPGIDGIELIPGSEQNSYKMISDGTGGGVPTPLPGGLFAAWSTAGGQLVAQRVKAGLRWGSAGLVVATHGAVLGYDLARDGSGGIVLCWVATDGAPPYRYTVRAQRLDVSGNPLWSSGGVIIIDSDVVSGTYNAPYYSAPAIASDDNGGAIVAWCDTRNYSSAPSGCTNGWTDLYAQRVDAGGSVVWNPLGVLLPPYLCGQVAPGNQGEPRIVPDSRNGAVVAYDDSGGWSWDIAGTRLNANGSKLWSQWIRSDSISSSDPGLPQTHVKLAFDASGGVPKGALLVWDEAGTGGQHRVYVQKVELDLTTPVIPANDTCSGAIALSENAYYALNTTIATDDGVSACLGRTRTKGVWFTYTPAQTGTATVDTCPSDFDTNLEVFTGGCGGLTSIGCNEDSSSCTGYWQASFNFPCAAGTTYFIYAGGYNGQSGNLQIRARLNTTPIILTNVQSGVSGTVKFTVLGAAGDEYIVFGSSNFLDWYQLGIISNATGAVDFTDPESPGLAQRFYRCRKP